MKTIRILLFSILFLSTYSIKAGENWTHTYGTEEGEECGTSIISTNDGNFIVSGYISDPKDMWILKLNSLGDTLWTKHFDNFMKNIPVKIVENQFNSILKIDNSNNYFITKSNSIIQINESGNILWGKNTGNNSIYPLENGGCIATGQKNNDLWVYRLDSDGNNIKENTKIKPFLFHKIIQTLLIQLPII